MKKLFSLLATAALIAACGDDVTEVTEVTEIVQNDFITAGAFEELPPCTDDNMGQFAFVSGNKSTYVCYESVWNILNGLNGENGKDGTNGTNGTNGKDGAEGDGCTAVALAQDLGYKIMCGKDSVGVLFNGKDGKNGRSAVVPGLANKLVKRMKRGINVGIFTSPGKTFKGFNDEGLYSDWTVAWLEKDIKERLLKKDFKIIADKGFDHIRYQIRWHTHFVGDSAKCQIDPEYIKQVKWAVSNTIDQGMIAIVNEHYLMMDQPIEKNTFVETSPCLQEIYKQIANNFYEFSPDSLIVELPNEPTHDEYITANQWNGLVDTLINIIHDVDQARVIIVGGREFYKNYRLKELELDNTNGLLIGSFHYYEPSEFTYQGVNVATDSPTLNDGYITWEPTPTNLRNIRNDFSVAADWSKKTGIPVYLGEYGVVDFAKDSASIENYLAAILQYADEFGFATAIHAYCAGNFNVYDLRKEDSNPWVTPKINAIFSTEKKYKIMEPPNLETTPYTVIDDFENYPNGKISADLGLNRSWSATRSSNVTLTDGQFINGHNGKGYRLIAEYDPNADTDNPWWSFVLQFSNESYDFSKMSALTFWAKGTGDIQVCLRSNYADSFKANADDWSGYFCTEASLSSEWSQFVFTPDEWVAERYSPLEAANANWLEHNTDVYAIEFKQATNVTKGTAVSVDWTIDDIRVYGMELSDFEN